MPRIAPAHDIALGFLRRTRQKGAVTPAAPSFRPLLMLCAGLALVCGGVAVVAQIEGGAERGVSPIDSSSSFEVTGIQVDVAAKTADAARYAGWRDAQRKGWKALWSRTHAGAAAPQLSDSALDAIVAGVVVENEQIGPTRYIARLGVLFDRARAGQILGVSGQIMRSPPLLVIPVQWSGAAPQSFETRTEWQKAWARFRTGSSAIDYVRPTGTGSDPLLLNASQAGRPGRIWWRMLLDQFGAADVLVPTVKLSRMWPGGPVIGRFSAHYGPDSKLLGEFTLRVERSELLPQLLDSGVQRLDELYVTALREGRLRPDPSLVIEDPVEAEEMEEAVEAADIPEIVTPDVAQGTTSVTVQFVTPDVAAVNATEAQVRGLPGVSGAATTSLAIGGTSIMRVVYRGDTAALRLALQARGWQVEEAGGVLRIRRGGGASPSPSATPTP